MGNGFASNSCFNGLHQSFERRSFQVRDKIEVLGKSLSVVTPADGSASLENKARTFGACIKVLEKDELEKLGAPDMSFGMCFHLFKL